MIYIIHNNYFLTKDLVKTVSVQDVVFKNINIKNISFIKKILRKITFILNIPYQDNWLEFEDRNFFLSLKKTDTIILFDCISSPYISFLKKHEKNRKIVWIWNKIKDEEIKNILQLKKITKEIWTFDKEDSEKFDIHYTNQFYWHKFQNEKKRINHKKVFFIGIDKGRYNEIMTFDEIYKGEKEFIVLRDETSKIANLKFYQTEELSYDETLKKINEADCLLEINLKNQIGLTLRALEALFFKKKLITNNRSIKNYNFYDPNNILILHKNITHEEITLFLEKEYVEIKNEILFQYSFENWLEKLLENKM